MFRFEKALDGAGEGDGEGATLARDEELMEASTGSDLMIVSYTSSEITPHSARLSSSYKLSAELKVNSLQYLHS